MGFILYNMHSVSLFFFLQSYRILLPKQLHTDYIIIQVNRHMSNVRIQVNTAFKAGKKKKWLLDGKENLEC